MAYTTKRRITTNLLHAAFVLLFLRGDIPSYYVDRSHRLNLNSSSSEYILGSSWGYSAQSNYHRSNYGSVHVHPKAIDSFEDQFLTYDQNDILDVIRSPSIQSFRTNIPTLSKVPTFHHNVTAYLLSNTSVSVSNYLPSIPTQVQPPVLLSLNVDVPSHNNNNNSNDAESGLNESSSSLNQIAEHQYQNQDELSFHLISGNIVLLPEADSNQNPDQELLDSLKLSTEDSDNHDNSEVETAEPDRVVPEGFDPSVYHEEMETEDLSRVPWMPPSEIPLWDELGHGLDEDFSLGLAFDEGRLAMEMLELEDQHPYGYSDEEAQALGSIPPMALHMPSTIDNEDEEMLGNDNASFIATQSIPSSSSASSSSGNLEAGGSVWNDDEIERVTLDSIIDELWETDSGIFEALLGSEDTEELEKLADTEDLQSENSPLRAVQVEDENSNLSGGFGFESSNEEENSSINESDMIQTASIYSNARPTHPVQPRGFQVHARMQGLLRGSSMDQRWQELASLLSLQPQHDPSGAPLPPPLPHHHFPPHHHHHHHLHHPSSSLHHHSMHHPPFSTAGPPAVVYNPDTARSVLLQNATLPGPPPELNTTSSYPNVSMGPPPNLGSALASSMHLTNSQGDPMIDPSSHYKMVEPSHHHDMLYYPNMTSNAGEMNNQSTEGFLSSILNDDDLQLMDMAMNEGLYTMRMMDNSTGAVGSSVGAGQGPLAPALSHSSACSIGAGVAANVQEDRMEASSDSAVSSMGSERVPTMTDPHMSDTEWTEPDAHPHSSHDSTYSSDYTSKLRGYEYYGKGEGMHRVAAPVAQKKHQMFGKRVQQEPSVHPYSHPSSGLCIPYASSPGVHPSNGSSDPLEMKYSCSVDFGRNDDGRVGEGPSEMHNNHTYSLPQSHLPASTLSLRDSRQQQQRPSSKEKSKKEMIEGFYAEEYLSRDDKRARTMGLPITTDDIINLPMDEFNERLSKYDLSESQLGLIRDIRRRGKNKVAAQNCRKRKLDQILQLADEVQKIRDRKYALLKDQESLLGRRNNLKEKYAQLYRTVFQALRDRDGNPYSPNAYSLQQAADGNIILVPHMNRPSTSGTSDSMDPSIRRKPKDEIKKDGHA